MLTITSTHKTRLDEIKKQLTLIGARESSFTRIELLFYESLSISRAYGESFLDNSFLANLKQLQAEQYQSTKAYFKKSSQREIAIKKFITRLKSIISKA
jgi:DNA-binding NarL/FixJ family response regulator